MKQLHINEALYQYIQDVSLREHPVMTQLRQHTASHALALMQIDPIQAQFMQFLMRMIGATRILELGTFTGYSALAMALALPEGGKLITCDINNEWVKDTHQYWAKAGVADKIELRMKPAIQSLNDLLQEGLAGTFDIIFIDADKTNYVYYYEYALQLVSAKGIILIDNVLWEGKVIDPLEVRGQTREIRKLNQLLKHDERVEISLLPIADGLFLVKPTEAFLSNRT